MSFGPRTFRATPLHRAEHAVLATALAAAVVWLVAFQHATTWGRVAFWAIAPDLVFIPIGLASRNGAWPSWGAAIYNATHTWVVLVPAAALASLAAGHVTWALVAWAFHVEADRALGFDLRDMRAARDAA